jgi:hypothetical protein
METFMITKKVESYRVFMTSFECMKIEEVTPENAGA